MDLPEHVSKIHPERDAETNVVEESVLESAQMSSRIRSDSARFQSLTTSIGQLACSEPERPAPGAESGAGSGPQTRGQNFTVAFIARSMFHQRPSRFVKPILAKTSIQNASLGSQLIFPL
jgi:hypothetical protein